VNAETFAWQLDVIKKDFDVITLQDCIARYMQYGRWPTGCVVLTVDDGYSDMYQWAWPELTKRKLPATFFVTTGFVDGNIWLWPDRLEYALYLTTLSSCSVAVDGKQVTLSLKNEHDRYIAWKFFSDYCICCKDRQRLTFIKQIEAALEIELPLRPPHEYAPVTWEQLREMKAGGVEIGGHTVHHPILSKIDTDMLDLEIGGCKTILEERLSASIKSFCYPNSGPGDVNDSVIAAVARAGYIGAVFGTNLVIWDRYMVPRMGVSNDRADFLWKLYGGETLSFARQSAKMN
jgi:peptidoglycan/xylan/chitin deacetylase (PgdA/CDA1 family)